MTLKLIIRDRKLTPEEAAKYRKVREQVAAELPELMPGITNVLHKVHGRIRPIRRMMALN